MKLAIIGTAGRGDDGVKLSSDPSYWRTMKAVGQIVTSTLKPHGLTGLVSGGAAYADHVAIALFLDGWVDHLTLHFPTAWKDKRYQSTFLANDPGNVANHYHQLFSRANALDSLGEIDRVIALGATVHVNAGGFKARNSDVANEADALLAFTFGNGAEVKDGGTADTVRKYLARRSNGSVFDGPLPAWHFCLNTLKLHVI